jgi:hypothetical protein
VTIAGNSLIQAAARNNAEWCAAMSRAHGLSGEFEPDAWAASARTPLFYPDAVTLAPSADPGALVGRIDTTAPGASIKDSLADLDLTSFGFQVLFEAQWIHRPAGSSIIPTDGIPTDSAPTDLEWGIAGDSEALRAWAIAWDGGEGHADLFRPELLEDPDTYVLFGRSASGQVVAGAVLSRSEQVVGVSNVFALSGGSETAWPVVLEAVHGLFPGMPAVGYEYGDDLAAAVRHGFEPIGPLRVWLHDRAGSLATGVGGEVAIPFGAAVKSTVVDGAGGRSETVDGGDEFVGQLVRVELFSCQGEV